MSARALRLFFFLGGMLFLFPALLLSQSQQELESRRKKLEDEIRYTNRLLEDVRKSQKNTVYELRLIGKRIEQRQNLIATLEKEVDFLDRQIGDTRKGIRQLNDELELLKEEYARVAYYAYRHQSAYNKLIFLFSAEDLNQAYQRLRYLDQIGEFIRNEARLIRQKEADKSQELDKLNRQKADKKALLDKQNLQLLKLEQEQAQKKAVKSKLAGKEKQLRAALRAKEKEARQLKKKIEAIIAREMAAKKPGKSGKTYELTPEEKALSGNFSANKGKLPWPTETGMISETFGVHQHPVLRNVKTKNNGVNIVTSEGSSARSVFDGEVVSVVTITATNKAVIVKHGEYFSVYANLDQVFVSKGDKVSTKEALGRVHTTTKGKTELHFEIWKGKQLLNPAYWILSR